MAVSEAISRLSAPLRGDTSPLLVTSPDCPDAVVEAYHALFTNVDLALGSAGGGLIAVAALDETANAALVAANLALVAAQSGDRTLLIDGEVQSPTLHEAFGAGDAPGLAQLLGGEQDDLRELAQSTTLPTLGLITAGIDGARHNRLERLGDVPAALLRLKNAADRVILALPPILTSTDVLRLGSYVDGVVVVITPGRTERAHAARARALLEKAEVPVLGVTLTAQ